MRKAKEIIRNQVMRFADPADMDVGNWDICTDNIISALAEAGYTLPLPAAPTEAMMRAGWRAIENDDGPASIWAAMTAAGEEGK